MYKIMLVEDDLTIAQAVADHLSGWGYQVITARDLQNVAAEARAAEPQLFILDIRLPYFNGFHWCQEIRKFSQAPILFLSSAADNMSIVMAVNLGGDDFVAKPFDLHVLTAKVQALLRRAYSLQSSPQIMEHDGALLNLGDASLSYAGKRLELTKNDLRILQLLLENAGKVVTRSAIMEALWQSDSYVDDNTLTVNVARLRKKLAEIGLGDWIKTKKNLGYLVE